MLRRLVFTLAVLAIGWPAGAAAQLEAGEFRIGPRLGYDLYAEKTSIDGAALLGLEATYFFARNIGFGAYLDVSRPSTDGNFYAAEVNFGNDSTLIFGVSQPLTVLKYGAELVGRAQVGERLVPYVHVGGGAYQIELDPQVAGASERITNLQFSVGAGLDIGLGRGSGVRIDVRDYVLTSFNRDDLDPVAGQFKPVRFPDVLPAQAPFDGTTSNLVFAISFTFTPGGAQ